MKTSFPDYARGSIYTTVTNRYEVPEDAFVVYFGTSSSSFGLLIDDVVVSSNDGLGTAISAWQFSGYVKKGSILKNQQNSNIGTSILKVFGLCTFY